MIVTEDAKSIYEPAPLLNYIIAYPGTFGPESTPEQQKAGTLSQGQIPGQLLYNDYGKTFWRFNFKFELHSETELQVNYTINGDAALGDFYLPSQGQTMNSVFHSCNGFSLAVNPDEFKGCLWKDVLRHHQVQHFHVMLGGGDQIYNDMVKESCAPIKAWINEKNSGKKQNMPFSEADRRHTEEFFLLHYIAWFGYGWWVGPNGKCLKPDFPKALATIPSINIFDDHDIIDGFGSYVESTMNSPVFSGIGQVAFKYYLLFQQQTSPTEDTSNEPSWISNPRPGPYIHESSRSIYARLGHSMAFLGLDCRTERKLDQIIYPDTYKIVFNRLTNELQSDKRIKHLLVMLGVPIAYPRLVWLESLLTSRVMSPIKSLAKHGIVGGGSLNNFDGAIEILDDLNDHWCAKTHKAERNQFVKDLQDLAQKTSVRITILAGDVHLAAMGRFHSAPSTKLDVVPQKDHRLMLNVVCSAITNTPPAVKMADFLNTRNKVHHLGSDTDEDMVRLFKYDVDGTNRNNRCLLPRRNWCSITEVVPSTYPVGYTNGLNHTAGTATKVAAGPRFPEENKEKGTFSCDNNETEYEDGPGALSIVLHVEHDQEKANGETRPYEVIAPLLKVE